MNALGWFIVVLAMALPVAWCISEFYEQRWLRVALGVAMLAMCVPIAILVGSLDRLNSNAWFGFATRELIDTTVSSLESGEHERVLQSLKKLQDSYSPTYENRARYDELVKAAVDDMKVR